MAATTTRRRITAEMTPTEKKRVVKELLHELAYVLNATRKVTREMGWSVAEPTATRLTRSAPMAAVA